jgi:hypothetical protein
MFFVSCSCIVLCWAMWNMSKMYRNVSESFRYIPIHSDTFRYILIHVSHFFFEVLCSIVLIGMHFSYLWLRVSDCIRCEAQIS